MQPKQMQGSRVLLFDRLVDENPEAKKERVSYRMYDREGLRQSVQQELMRLLNTRRAQSDVLDPAQATVLDYGLPDFSAFSAASTTDRQQLGRLLTAAITAFEPRLLHPHVDLSATESDQRSLDGVITGQLRIGEELEPVAFPVLLRRESGSVEILEPPTLDAPQEKTAPKELPR
jgi:type VI secretion system lysozyme-related protein